MSVFYVAAGVNHFWHRDVYLQIMPPWLPWHTELVIISGIFEILFALLLIFQRSRKLAAWSIILILVAVFPANIQMMINYSHESNPGLWIATVRLPIQIILIWWAYSFTRNQLNS